MPARKRQAPSSSTPEVSGSRRRSVRIGSSGKKSQYFEGNSDESESEAERARQPKRAKTATSSRGKAKVKVESDVEEDDAYDDEDEQENEQDDDSEEEEYDDENDADRGSSKKRGVNGKSKSRAPVFKAKLVARKKKEQDDSDEDQDDDNDGRPKTTFIPDVPLRPLDGVEYEDHRLHKNTMLFLKDLKANNTRPWLKRNDAEFRRSLEDWKTYVTTLTTKITERDETVPELPTKDIIFRIYRDVRFSKDQTPYKSNYSAAWSRTGKKGPYACYYVHCQPGNSFVGGGLWHPEKAYVDALRTTIDERPGKWRRALGEEGFRSTFLPKAKKGDPEAAVKAFCAGNQGNALKKKPQDYPADHRDIELLKLRNYTVIKKLPDSIYTDKDGQQQMADIIGAMVGFVTFLNRIVMPDPDDSDSDSEEEGDE